MELGWALIALMAGGAIGWISIFLFWLELRKTSNERKIIVFIYFGSAMIGWFGSLIVASYFVGQFIERFV